MVLACKKLSRLTSSCVLKPSTELSDVLVPLQVLVPGGADTLACAVEASVDEEPSCATIRMDTSNAFCTAQRNTGWQHAVGVRTARSATVSWG